MNTYNFSSCANLKTVVISEGVTTIPAYTFASCKSLESVTIPESVTIIGNSAFTNCGDFTIKCYADSYAHQWAIDNNIDYELIVKNTVYYQYKSDNSALRFVALMNADAIKQAET